MLFFALFTSLLTIASSRLTLRNAADEMDSYLKVYSCNHPLNKHLHVFTQKFPTNLRRVRWHPAKPSKIKGQPKEEDVSNRMFFIGGEKLPSPIHFRVTDFKFDVCPGTEGDPVKLTNISLLGPAIVPGDVNLTFSGHFDQDISSPVVATIEAYKEILGVWMRLPCVNDFGSCTFDDICGFSRYTSCPADFVRDGIPCHCPVKKGTYHTPGLQVYAGVTDSIDFPSWLTDGRYKATVMTFSNGKRLNCIDSMVTVRKV